MKKQFVAIKTEAKNGKTYTLQVFQIISRSKPLEYIASTKATYGCQYGEQSEAWQAILEKQPRLKNWILKQGGRFCKNYHRASELINIDVIS